MNTDRVKIANLFGSGLVGRIDANWTEETCIDPETGNPYTCNIREDERNYYIKDHLGSIRVTVNEEGEVVSAQDYYPFGEILRSSTTGGIQEKYKFTSKERDSYTEYDYFGARYYDSEICRWLSPDPLTNLYPGWSPYNYALNNPLRLVDIGGFGPATAQPATASKWYPEIGFWDAQFAGALFSMNSFVPPTFPSSPDDIQADQKKLKNASEKGTVICFAFTTSLARLFGLNGEFGVAFTLLSGEAVYYGKWGISGGFAKSLGIELSINFDYSLQDHLGSREKFSLNRNSGELEIGTKWGANFPLDAWRGDRTFLGFGISYSAGYAVTANSTQQTFSTPRFNFYKLMYILTGHNHF
jgi:RHS repeat-associated protein